MEQRERRQRAAAPPLSPDFSRRSPTPCIFTRAPFRPNLGFCPKIDGWSTLILAYKTLGVVFGGLVTSPLYVYPSMNLKSPSDEDYLGIYCIMFWTLTLIGVVKYVGIALNADAHGEVL